MLTTLRVQNVRQAFSEGIHLVATHGIAEPSRNGPVLVMPGPLVTTYEHPCQRVLVDPLRDANPFFHLMESIWMLAGRRDVESLMRFNAGMKKYSDDGETFHGAYGHRWRHHFGQHEAGPGIDQLAAIIQLLRENPNDRRIVLQMWDPAADLGQEGLDFPCNNLCYFRVRKAPRPDLSVMVDGEWQHGEAAQLDMTVVCRSNDMLWGGYGANAVHFSVLQEFVAAMVGVGVGEMHQLSNNAHLYEATLPPVDQILPYTGYPHEPVPLFGDLSAADPVAVLAEIEQLWDDDPDGEVELLPATTLQLVGGMRRAWAGWKARDWSQAVEGLSLMVDSGHMDWHLACREWLQRRSDKFA